ncbi:hypothetical protein GCM10012287_49600 [Streptomyces daqingensis]|uniref:Uncharacterized protein n=1 Tax=Streptomyces daqingensis TaxID=1472640 RepID=A0ABQ2MQP6_9ACTN|nr:hypothetical protein GCM10012287_49600 [Streptomyces daqingensis]
MRRRNRPGRPRDPPFATGRVYEPCAWRLPVGGGPRGSGGPAARTLPPRLFVQNVVRIRSGRLSATRRRTFEQRAQTAHNIYRGQHGSGGRFLPREAIPGPRISHPGDPVS